MTLEEREKWVGRRREGFEKSMKIRDEGLDPGWVDGSLEGTTWIELRLG